MSEAIRKILDAVTDRVFAYRPKDKGQQAKKIERRVKRERKKAEKVGEILTREFSIKRDAHSVQVRMTQLACDPNIEAAS